MKGIWYHQAKIKLFLRYRLRNVSITFRKNLNKPTYLCLKISEQCNAQCLHCNIWKLGSQPQEMTTEQVQKLFLQLRKWFGPFSLHITGGEPLLRKDLIDILAYAYRHQILVELLTNGWLLDETKAEQIVRAGVYRVTISLDGINPITHDTMRGKPGFYKQVNSAINYLRKYQEMFHSSMLLVVKTVINRNNLDELLPLVDWVKEKGITGVIYQPIEQNYGEPINPDWYKTSKLWVSDLAKLISIMDTLYELKKFGAPILNKLSDFNMIKEYFTYPERLMKKVQQHADLITPQACYNGVSNFVVSSNGDVRMCFQMNPIGNITQKRPEQIWKARPICWKTKCPY
jgi:MoaA/NifB/PqqE/SkfB family radical SAM enzyme